MRDWESAKEHFQQLTDLYPDNETAKKELGRVALRLEETRTGHYNLGGKGNECRRHDVADYTGPVKVTSEPELSHTLYQLKY